MVTIYALVAGQDVKYVGATTISLRSRLGVHLYDARRGSPYPVHQWIRELRDKPQSIVLETDPLDGADDGERRWIADLRSKGYKLLNHQGGGRAGFTTVVTPDTKAKIRASNLGKKHTQASKEKMRVAKLGKPGPWLGKTRSPETLVKLSEAAKGRKHTPEAKRKMSQSQKGRIVSADTRAKMSAALKGRTGPMKGKTHSLETRQKIGAANSVALRGRTLSLEHRQKIIDARKRRATV
jgi:hypothetical protein